MKKLLLLFVILLVGCSNEVSLEKITYEKTQVEDIERFVEHYESLGYEGDIEASLEVYDIDQKIGAYKVYKAELDYAMVYDFVFEKGGELFSMYSGYIADTYLVDTDGDGDKELMTVGDYGSGLLLINVSHFDPVSGIITRGRFYNDNDWIEFDTDGKDIYAYDYYSFERRAKEPIGKVTFSKEITIDGLAEQFETKVKLDLEGQDEKDH